MTSAAAARVVVAPYAAADRQAVIELVLHVQNVEFGLDIPIEAQPDVLRIAEDYQAPGGGFWVARAADGAVVGTIGLQVKAAADGAWWGIMKKFFVRADHRGRAHGVAAQLYDALLAHASQRRLRGIVLDTPARAERSHAFYRRAGFREITADALPVVYPYADRDSRLLRLDLPNEA